MTRRRAAATALASRVLDHLDALDRAARHGDQTTYARASLELRQMLVEAIDGRPPQPPGAP